MNQWIQNNEWAVESDRESSDPYLLVCESLNRRQYGNLHLRLAIYYLLTSMPECLIQLVNYI